MPFDIEMTKAVCRKSDCENYYMTFFSICQELISGSERNIQKDTKCTKPRCAKGDFRRGFCVFCIFNRNFRCGGEIKSKIASKLHKSTGADVNLCI